MKNKKISKKELVEMIDNAFTNKPHQGRIVVPSQEEITIPEFLWLSEYCMAILKKFEGMGK